MNGALNYGYAITRAAIARALVCYGLLPTFGLHHNSEMNAYNLADDMIEVFRPFVDDLVKIMHLAGELGNAELTKENRQKLAGILNATCLMRGEVHTLANAADKAAERLVIATEKKDPKELLFPEIRTTLL